MASHYEFETLDVQRNAEEPRVLEVALNRPEKLNAMNHTFFLEMKRCFRTASADPEVHCVLIHGGRSRVFSAGLDLNSEMGGGNGNTPGTAAQETKKLDVSRRALRMEKGITEGQEALHGAVIGGGIDLACACDIRYCTADTFFCIAEVNIGIAADIGTLQRLPNIVGNDSIVRELALTA